MREVRVVVARRKHLALLGHADAAVLEPDRLREDGLGRGAAAARNAAAAGRGKA